MYIKKSAHHRWQERRHKIMKKDKKQKTLQRIMEYMKPYRFLIFASLVLAVISVALTLYVPILTGQGVDCIISKGNVDFARLISIIKTIVICIVLTAAAQWLMNHVNNQITYKIGKDLRIQAFEHLQKLPLSYVDAHSSGDLLSRIVTDIDQFTDGLLLGFTQLFTGVITIIGTICFMLGINPWITLVVVILSPFSFFIASFISKRSFNMFRKQSQTRGNMTGFVNEMLGNIKVVKVFDHGEKAQEEFDQINDDLVLIGLVAIRDDVRPSAKDAIREVQEAGIQVVMITGDRLETAVAIAKDAGLLKNESDRALSSAQLNQMSDDEVKAILPEIRVIARALPTDKSRMVRLCQEMNLVVGMTGDGVNDSPALKRADVGFAMGSGTEAAKEAGKIVILDDNFSSIKDAIWYGRTIYHNILKFCRFQLVINVAAVVVSAVAPFFGVEEPLKVTHLLFVNLVMDGLGAMMLGNEPALHKYMKEAPRKRDESIICKDMAIQIGWSGVWLVILSFLFLKLPVISHIFDNEAEHLTAYFVLFIFSALFNGFNVRDDRFGIFKRLNENPDFLKVFFIIMLVQIIIVNAALIPFPLFTWIGNMFSCIPFEAKGWIVTVLLSMTMIPVDCLRKFLFGCGK